MHIVGWFFIILNLWASTPVEPQDKFIDKLDKRFRRESYLRPTDTLLYVPTVLNLHRFYSEYKQDCRKNVFKFLSKGRILLTYPYALDINHEESYHNPYGEWAYWSDDQPSVVLVRDNPAINHERYTKEMQMLIKYAKEKKPEYLFKVREIDGIDYEIYWSIVGRHLFVLKLSIDEECLVEYGALEYVNTIAPDVVFLSDLRLEALME